MEVFGRGGVSLLGLKEWSLLDGYWNMDWGGIRLFGLSIQREQSPFDALVEKYNV